MREMLGGFLFLICLGGKPSQAQTLVLDGPGAVLGAITDFRVEWLGDSTAWVACSVDAALGHPADFAAVITPALRPFLQGMGQDCIESVPVPRTALLLDSIALEDSVAHVMVTVWRGEHMLHERYVLQRVAALVRLGVPAWRVLEVTLSGPARVQRGHPSGS